ncbi:MULTISPECIES: hypothetical protein [Geomicrobium]|uniref:Uncharacterized protein n=1 Tax=Geomicrobium sediminis TaxID=1347788 RepID=A0ABS2P9A9_9BACL|nr:MULTISPECIES: hypothetical protein [Geomicrobium]MBM7631985.1 hypothetical protein [Geomicrobium sediminis]GAK08557.1 hypothetical protein JCM19038_2342 [Geomicrobium sp. JCM 19038]
MKLLPFENTWPYEKVGEDVYLHECPDCGDSNVLTFLKTEQLQDAFDNVKTQLIMPCCNYRITILQADEDYFWTSERQRK